MLQQSCSGREAFVRDLEFARQPAHDAQRERAHLVRRRTRERAPHARLADRAAADKALKDERQ